ncbi:MAG TPA: hypothetical protein VMP01_27505 [Pirellulaceae bacterium]|nr:hypothetical protein [Pirellulaceae bacterium]
MVLKSKSGDESPHSKSKSRRWLLIAPLLLLAGAIAGGLVIWLGSGTSEPEVAQGPLPPIAAEPPSPPPGWKGQLAAPESNQAASAPGDLEKSLQKLSGLVAAIGPELKNVPRDAAAPTSLLVLPGEARTVDAASRIPRHERWEIQFPPGNTIDSYSRQLDFFKIELGVIGDADKVVYLANLSAPTPTSRSEAAGKDNRLYLIWQRGALREAAEELASRAKVDPRGKVLAHFCPAELETQLAQLEEKHAADKGHAKIRRTTFGIEPSDAGGYRFYVIDQQADDR